MEFSIIIPTYNNLPELRRCLASLEGLAEGGFEVWVCVDGSTDGTVAALETAAYSYPLHIRQHAGGVNRGRAATRNLALAELTGTFILFLDSDMVVPPDLLGRHRAVLVSGNTVSIGAVRYRNAGENPWARYTAARGVGKFQPGAVVPFQYFITPNTALPAAWVRDCGGFDAAIRGYGGEDMELGYRLHLRVAPQFIYNAAAVVETVQDKTLGQALLQLQEYGAGGLPYILRKHPALSHIYLLNRVHSPRLGDRLFELLTLAPFRKIAWALQAISPFFLRKHLINYLVICYVHAGFRSAQQN